MLIQHRTQDFDFIHQGIVNILDQQIASTHNLLPGAKKSVPYAPETGTLLFPGAKTNLGYKFL
jgi:hypothetical protein